MLRTPVAVGAGAGVAPVDVPGRRRRCLAAAGHRLARQGCTSHRWTFSYQPSADAH